MLPATLRGESGFEPDPGADRGSTSHERVGAGRAHFDPAAEISDRPDRTVRNAELAGLLRFYLGRAVRHDVMRDDAADEAEWMLGSLDKVGVPAAVHEVPVSSSTCPREGPQSSSEDGVEYHQIGRDLIEELLDALPTDPFLAAKGAGVEREHARPLVTEALHRPPSARQTVCTRLRTNPRLT